MAGKAVYGTHCQGKFRSGRKGELGSGVFRFVKLWQAISQRRYQNMTYQWKVPGIMPVDAQTAGNELQRIYERDGVIEPETVVEESESPSAPLHSCFEWDNEKAAHKYRITQAQGIIRAIVAVDETKKNPETRAFVSVQREYQPISVVIRNPEKRDVLLKNALDELRWFERKYNTLNELSGVFEAIKEVTA